MSSALIGYTGFVGSNILKNEEFDYKFNSSNIHSIKGKHFKRIVCAGAQSVKWLANKEPEADWNSIEKLINELKEVTTDTFILISTVDVYQPPQNANETTLLSTSIGDPYGRHRLMFEEFIKQQFKNTHIIRLPALFGFNLKKNVLFDMLNNNRLEFINPKSSFQWYDLSRLTSDIKKIEENNLSLVNLMPEPIETEEIKQNIFPSLKIGSQASNLSNYNVKTIHHKIFSGLNGYIYGRDEVLIRIVNFQKGLQFPPSRKGALM